MDTESESANKSIDELQWAHATLLRLVDVVRRHGLIGGQGLIMAQEAVVTLTKGVVVLESVIQENLRYARRRREDTGETR